jgi:hypothetical protein
MDLLFREVDTSRDGKISYVEFETFYLTYSQVRSLYLYLDGISACHNNNTIIIIILVLIYNNNDSMPYSYEPANMLIRSDGVSFPSRRMETTFTC